MVNDMSELSMTSNTRAKKRTQRGSRLEGFKAAGINIIGNEDNWREDLFEVNLFRLKIKYTLCLPARFFWQFVLETNRQSVVQNLLTTPDCLSEGSLLQSEFWIFFWCVPIAIRYCWNKDYTEAIIEGWSTAWWTQSLLGLSEQRVHQKRDRVYRFRFLPHSTLEKSQTLKVKIQKHSHLQHSIL